MQHVNTYESEVVLEYRQSTKDRNFCTVLALHLVTGNPMKECDIYMMKYGRRFRKGMFEPQIESALNGMKKFKAKKGEYSDKNRICVSTFCKKHPKGKYYILVRGHAFAIIDGVVYDYKEGGRRQITQAWRVYSQEELIEMKKEKINENI